MLPSIKYQFFGDAIEIALSVFMLCIVILVLTNTIYATIYKVANMPSAPQTRHAIIKDIQNRFMSRPDLLIYNLGSGWGGLCRKLAAADPSYTVKGFEISIIPYCVSKLMQMVSLRHPYFISRGDLFTVNMNDADVVICYLSPYHMDRVALEIIPHMKSGSILYSQGFPLHERKADDVINVPLSIEKKIYRYDM